MSISQRYDRYHNALATPDDAFFFIAFCYDFGLAASFVENGDDDLDGSDYEH